MDEQKFITDLRAKDQQAYARLLDEYQQRVFNTCLSFVPNNQDAEDIAQEVFIEIYNSITKFKGNSRLSTWIYRITTNKCLEFIRKKSTKKRLGFIQSLSGTKVPLDKTPYFTEFDHPGVKLERKEQQKTLFMAINRLPEAQKVVFTLHKIDGFSYKEVSRITERSASSVESLLFRAKRNLKKTLAEYYERESNPLGF